jgi:hypothetical protein
MAEFVAFHPDNETLGQAFMGIIHVLQGRGIEDLLQKHGLTNIHPEKWYPQQKELDMLRDIGLLMDFVAIGMKIPDLVEYGVEVKTIADAFLLLDAGYQHNHRGPEVGGFQAEWTGKRSMRIVCHNPYPSDLDYGIIYRLVQKFHPAAAASFSVLRDPAAPNRKLGDETDTFNIAW